MTLSWSHLYSQLVPANEKENFTIPHYWPFVKGIPHKGPVMGKVFTSYGAIMVSGPQLVQANNKEDITFTKDIHCSFNHELFSVEWRIFPAASFCRWQLSAGPPDGHKPGGTLLRQPCLVAPIPSGGLRSHRPGLRCHRALRRYQLQTRHLQLSKNEMMMTMTMTMVMVMVILIFVLQWLKVCWVALLDCIKSTTKSSTHLKSRSFTHPFLLQARLSVIHNSLP